MAVKECKNEDNWSKDSSEIFDFIKENPKLVVANEYICRGLSYSQYLEETMVDFPPDVSEEVYELLKEMTDFSQYRSDVIANRKEEAYGKRDIERGLFELDDDIPFIKPPYHLDP